MKSNLFKNGTDVFMDPISTSIAHYIVKDGHLKHNQNTVVFLKN